jgi:small subunit ribosomal protein S6
MAQIVTTGGGSMVFNDRMGRRRLAYPIQKHEDGIYIRFLYDSEAEVPRELERRFRLSDNVLRHLTVRLERDWAEQAKQDAVREAKRREEAAVAAAQEAEQARLAAERAKAEAEAAESESADATEASSEDVAPAEAAPEGEKATEEAVTPEQDSEDTTEEPPAETKE